MPFRRPVSRSRASARSAEEAAEEEEFNKNNPLTGEVEAIQDRPVDGPSYLDQMKGAKLETAGHCCNGESQRIVLALSDATTPEVTLEFETPG